MPADALFQPMVIIGDDDESNKCTTGKEPCQIFIDPKEGDEDQGAAENKNEQAIPG